MITTVCTSWDHFLVELAKLTAEHEAHQINAHAKSPLLFRGQSNAEWSLLTTLERSAGSPKLMDYYTSMWAAKPQIEAYTDKIWDIPSPETLRDRVYDSDAGFRLLVDVPGYDFMAYLRHHGFPSPLLDWSKSPMIAAFFAFQHARTTDPFAAIYAYREYSGAGKSGWATGPKISMRGPCIRTHRRHFLQQCHYTLCYRFVPHPSGGGVDQWQYVPHEQGFAAAGPGQDTLWKFQIPTSERDRALAYLDTYNLNAYSLFASEEALMEMLAARELR